MTNESTSPSHSLRELAESRNGLGVFEFVEACSMAKRIEDRASNKGIIMLVAFLFLMFPEAGQVHETIPETSLLPPRE